MNTLASQEKQRLQAGSTGERIAGLDVWRVALMLGGLLLHGSLWQPPQPLFTAIGVVSSSFRMGSFFALSGLLCGIALRKRTSREWLVRRLVQVGLPMSFGWGVLCPLVLLLNRWYPHAPVPLMFDWHHIWFLVALLIYAPGTVFLCWLDQKHGLVARLAAADTSRSPTQILLRLGAVSFILMGWTALLVHSVAPKPLIPMLMQAPNITGYLPLYLFGVAVARSPLIADTLWRSFRSAVAIIVTVGSVYAILILTASMFPQANQIGSLMRMVAAALCPPAAFALIYRSAIAISRIPSILQRLCDASLTIYLLHLPILLAVNAVLSTFDWDPHVQFIVAIAIAGVFSYGAHVGIVRPVPLLSLIVNGRIENWRKLISVPRSMLRARA